LESTADLDEMLRHWKNPMFFSNGRRANASFFFGQPNQHCTVHVNCNSSRVGSEVAGKLARDLGGLLSADLATVYYRREEGEEWVARYKAVYPMCLGLTTHNLQMALPELPWYACFGKPYIELLGRERLASCPAFRTAPVGNDAWELQLTADARASRSTPRPYVAAREAAKQHLGREHFLDLMAPERRQRVPDFGWTSTVQNPIASLLDNKIYSSND